MKESRKVPYHPRSKKKKSSQTVIRTPTHPGYLLNGKQKGKCTSSPLCASSGCTVPCSVRPVLKPAFLQRQQKKTLVIQTGLLRKFKDIVFNICHVVKSSTTAEIAFINLSLHWIWYGVGVNSHTVLNQSLPVLWDGQEINYWDLREPQPPTSVLLHKKLYHVSWPLQN